MALPPGFVSSLRIPAAVALALGAHTVAQADTYTWSGPNTAPTVPPFNLWSNAANWGGTAPTGTNNTDIPNFSGDGTSAYSATNDFASPFILNQLVTSVTGSTGVITLNATGAGSLALAGSNPQILQNGVGSLSIDMPVLLRSNVTFGGTGSGTVTINGPVSGNFDITKVGSSVFRFGSASDLIASDNTWVGNLNIQGGIFRFNNNAVSGRTALRSNSVTLSAGSTLTVSSELRTGGLNGAGLVSTSAGTPGNSESIVIHAIHDGVFNGSISIGPASGGSSSGKLVVRGGSQTFTQLIQTSRGDVEVGIGSTVVLSGDGNLSTEVAGGVELHGGTFVLDNTAKNLNRLREISKNSSGVVQSNADSTILDTKGGGTFTLIGNTAGTTEVTTRLQLGSINNSSVATPRSGALNINLVHRSTTAATVLQFAAYTRSTTSTVPQFATVDFSAQNGSGTTLDVGLTGANARVLFSDPAFAVPLSSGLMDSTAGIVDAGWATVNGTDFATYNTTNGVTKVTTSTFPTGSSAGNAATNYNIDGNRTTQQNFQASSIRLSPTATGQLVTLGAATTLTTRGIVMGGSADWTIAAGTLGGTSSRYIFVKSANLTVDSAIGGTGALVKSGAGTLTLTNTANASNSSMMVVNQGQLRSALNTLTGGELRLRGGVVEVSGGGTFNRTVGTGAGNINWAGVDSLGAASNDDVGSGGFAAINGDLTVDLGGAAQTSFAWEDPSFVDSGLALTFGSAAANSKVTWVDNLSLSAGVGEVNYNARDIRVIDNPSVLSDRVTMTGTISGSFRDDLLKSGGGVLELSGTNSYAGATWVKEGTLLVNGTNANSFLTTALGSGRLGGTGAVKTVRIESGGTLNPGDVTGANQAGTFTINGDLTFTGATSNFQLEIGTGVADKVNVNGAVVLNGAQLSGSLLNGFTPQANDLFFVIINDGSDAVQGIFAQGTSVVLGGIEFTIGYDGNSTAGTFTGGNDVVLRAVPEPSTALLLGSAIGLLASRRRRRRA